MIPDDFETYTAEEAAELVAEQILEALDGLDDDDEEAATAILGAVLAAWQQSAPPEWVPPELPRVTVAELRHALGDCRARLARGEKAA
jgi:hypothetical protein